MALKITLNPSDFEATAAQFRRALKDVAEDFADELRRNAPVSKGRSGPYGRTTGKHLRDLIEVKVRGDTIFVLSEAPHLEPQAEGTAPHFIFPKKGEFLIFPLESGVRQGHSGNTISGERDLKKSRKKVKANRTGQKLIKAAYVLHPGHDPHPFVQRAVSKLPRLIADALSQLNSGS